MTKEQIRDALASVLGFKPVKTVRQKLLVISVHALLWGLFLIMPLFIYRIRIPDVSFYYREIINKSFLVILFYINFYFLLPRFFRNQKFVQLCNVLCCRPGNIVHSAACAGSIFFKDAFQTHGAVLFERIACVHNKSLE